MNNLENIDISVVIPAKDEEARLPAFLRSLMKQAQQSQFVYEIIVVDDGSRDQTAATVQAFQKEFPLLSVLRLSENHGKGYAVKRGVLIAQGRWVVFMDADGSTAPQAIETNLKFLNQGYDIVIGSRIKASQEHRIEALWYRKAMGTVFNWLVHCLLIRGIEDTQCGFKIFRREVAQDLFGRSYVQGFGFDLEILFLAVRLHYRVNEVAVNWRHVDGSKIGLFKDSLKMFVNILQVRCWHSQQRPFTAPHMPVEEIERMHQQEKNHWWFVAKTAFIRKLIAVYGGQITSALDAGCGTGQHKVVLPLASYYVACDVSIDALNLARAQGVEAAVQGDLHRLPLKQGQFDLVMGLDVLEHAQDPYAVLTQWRRMLNAGGRLLITVPAVRCLYGPHDTALSHFRRYSRADLIGQLTDQGFEVRHCGYLFASIFLPVFLWRSIKNLFDTSQVACDTAYLPSPWVNQLMKQLMRMELGLLTRVSFLGGTTLYAVAVKAKHSREGEAHGICGV